MERIKPALDHIVRHYAEDISIQELAEQCAMSVYHFCRVFKAVTGDTTISYINQLRIKNACHLLSNTDTGVAEIAFSCGYRNLSNFNRQFRQMVNCTPGAYRRILRQAR